MADEQTTLPLIRTKLHQPPVTKNHLHREHLLDRLEKNRQRSLPLVSAPAGYGKNTLLSCWLDLLHCDHIETNVSHVSPLNPICGILVARVSCCEMWHRSLDNLTLCLYFLTLCQKLKSHRLPCV